MKAWRFTVGLAVLVLCVCGRAPAKSAVRYDVLALPALQAAVDPTGTASLRDAQDGRLRFVPYRRFRFPGSASSIRPLVLWFTFPAPDLRADGPWFIEGGRYLGNATLFTPTQNGFQRVDFGMRVPFNDRVVKRTWPTAPVANIAPGRPVFLRAQLDLEFVPLAIANAGELSSEDFDAVRNQRLMMLITGVFLALALCNLLAFAYIREAPYALYSLSMLVLAALGPMSANALAWETLWPSASVSDMWVRYPALFLEGYISFAFAYAFLRPWEYSRTLDRICRILFVVFPLLDALEIYGIPSVSLGADIKVSDLQGIEETVMFFINVFLGITAIRAGRRSGYFIIAGYGVVAFAHGLFTASSIFVNAVALQWTYLVQLGGRAFEGFVLFAALVDRLRETMRERTLAEQRATIDALTAIANRRMFDTTLDREWKRAQRAGTSLALAMIDVDHFKRYNDENGHLAGDECLRRVAATISSTLHRPEDLAARYGGEEFAVILPSTDLQGALTIAERICDRVRRTQDVTVSIGVAASRCNDANPRQLLDNADQALYSVKSRGRDGVAHSSILSGPLRA